MEFIGFLISLLALLYLYFKQKAVARYRREHPEIFHAKREEIEEDNLLDELFSDMEPKVAKRPLPPSPPQLLKAPPKHQPSNPQPKKSTPAKPRVLQTSISSPLEVYRLESSLEKRKIKSTLEARRVEPNVREHYDKLSELEERPKRPSIAATSMKRLINKKDLLIYHEIIDKPRSLRPFS